MSESGLVVGKVTPIHNQPQTTFVSAEQLNAMYLNMVLCSRSDLEDLILYADVVAKILREQGFPGKAEGLEKRYMKLSKLVIRE